MPEITRAEAFARRFADDMVQGFTEPPFPDVPPMPDPPRAQAVDGDEPAPHPPWPERKPAESPLVPQRAVPAPREAQEADLRVVGAEATYRGLGAILSEREQAAVGRIVLESAQRVIRERLAEARGRAPRRKAKVVEAVAEPPKKRGRPKGSKNKPKGDENA